MFLPYTSDDWLYSLLDGVGHNRDNVLGDVSARWYLQRESMHPMESEQD